VRWFISQFCGSLSALRSLSGVTPAANADDVIASTLLANNAMHIELLRFVMKSSPITFCYEVLPLAEAYITLASKSAARRMGKSRARLTRCGN